MTTALLFLALFFVHRASHRAAAAAPSSPRCFPFCLAAHALSLSRCHTKPSGGQKRVRAGCGVLGAVLVLGVVGSIVAATSRMIKQQGASILSRGLVSSSLREGLYTAGCV